MWLRITIVFTTQDSHKNRTSNKKNGEGLGVRGFILGGMPAILTFTLVMISNKLIIKEQSYHHI